MSAKIIKNHPEAVNQVTASIVFELSKVGLYHYNKLTYLFEYLFIKNFGMKFTHELFCKLPHGPVISNYKKQITKLTNENFYDTDLNLLNEKRKLNDDDDYHIMVNINKTDLTEKLLIQNSIIYNFLLKVIDKYSHFSIDQLEEVVYQTLPVKNYLNNVQRGFKKEIGGYVLDCITLKEFKTDKVLGRQTALKNSLKFPTIHTEQHQNFYEEFKYLEKMRPAWGNLLHSKS